MVRCLSCLLCLAYFDLAVGPSSDISTDARQNLRTLKIIRRRQTHLVDASASLTLHFFDLIELQKPTANLHQPSVPMKCNTLTSVCVSLLVAASHASSSSPIASPKSQLSKPPTFARTHKKTSSATSTVDSELDPTCDGNLSSRSVVDMDSLARVVARMNVE